MKTVEGKDKILYLTTHTSWNSAKKLIDILESGEEVRVWEDMTGYHINPVPTFTVYAMTHPGSAATNLLHGSAGITKIDKMEFEDGIDLGLSKEAWNSVKCKGKIAKTNLLIMAGLSLPNKLELCREIATYAKRKMLFISTEETRKFVVTKMGESRPSYNFEEDKMTEKISLELVRMGLRNGCNVIFDAKNMTETERMGVYAASADGKTEALVVYVPPIDSDSTYISALRNKKLKNRLEKKVDVKFIRAKCSRPAITIKPYTDHLDAITQISKNSRIKFDLTKK